MRSYFPFRGYLDAPDSPGDPGDPVPAQRGSPVEEKLQQPDGEWKQRAEQWQRHRFGNAAHQLRELRPPVAFRWVQDGYQALRWGECAQVTNQKDLKDQKDQKDEEKRSQRPERKTQKKEQKERSQRPKRQVEETRRKQLKVIKQSDMRERFREPTNSKNKRVIQLLG